ncbi:type IV conjugative transfer system protein TraL [Pantoea allii]|jgi:conjugal transfer pilus assembly protein TraL|uniref:Protein TraL n=1 Tax=Pantoea allii TaxID=574096 RepID=A0ABS6VJE5_9GAMM|nr:MULTISPECIES: type IV conjugative transfer system protein TraL [Pantoea]MBW1215804.1 type IV conjugative transfer system protein TraL [Pantoea allii]MBW1254625.1 type IV conjugative transfer system protein TraL [Pantoea allii]MBW1259452.1 type IV conjugative transfer system protein TraL [Pantoea allii]MBW1263715.1 type IV conjugative transfer system protein TraL [Pantoea allii]MBW1268502.1 type IV conjugative transfer system protein TraL [Pantoea allii]
MDGDAQQYLFPETLNQQKRLMGLPTEEAIVVIACAGIGLLCDIFIVMLFVAGALWLLIRHLKKGQGTWWLLNLLYWYLPTVLLRLQFRRVPDSANRHWMQ